MTPVLLGLIFFSISGCGDDFTDSSITVHGQNKYFKLELTVKDDIVKHSGVLAFSATVERLIHADSIIQDIEYYLKMDASSGTVIYHSSTSNPSSSSTLKSIYVFTSDIDNEAGSNFEGIASFVPGEWNSNLKKYIYKGSGIVSASFNGINLVIPIQILCCDEIN